MRLQTGLRADSPWIDPDAGGFDAEAVVRSFREWQAEPLAAVHHLHQGPAGGPPVLPGAAGDAEGLGRRGGVPPPPGGAADPGDKLIEVERIEAVRAGARGAETVDP